MADTGAPWNLPYPLDTDLVRDGAQAIEDLAVAVASGLDAAGGLVQFKFVTETTDQSTSSTSLTTLPGASITITPQDAANNIYMAVFGTITIGAISTGTFRFRRDTTDLFEDMDQAVLSAGTRANLSGFFVENAASTSSRDYLVRYKTGTNTVTVQNYTFVVAEVRP
jgi:hypothetical protein